MSNQRKPEPKPGRTGNRLLDRLPQDEYAHVAPCLVSASLELKQYLIQPNALIPDIYFPTTALVSTLVVMEDGSEVETGITGAEGMFACPPPSASTSTFTGPCARSRARHSACQPERSGRHSSGAGRW